MEILIVGGGAAGMMAACTAAAVGGRVTLIERNAFCGMKVNITGKGRCNLTNNCTRDELLASVLTNSRFLYSALAAMPPQRVMEYFETLGVPLKTERGKRVFPVSDRARDISGALQRQMDRLGVRVLQGKVVEILTENGAAAGVRLADGRTLAASRVILATGGRSYPKTGSDGSGYGLVQPLGHTVTALRPSLTPLLAAGDYPRRLEGLSLKNVQFTVAKQGKVLFSDFGEMVFTAKGVSGPLVLSASAHLDRGKHTYPYQAQIDLKPALTAEALDKRLLRDFGENQNRDFSNALSALLPAKLIPVMVESSGIPPHQKVNSITRGQREALRERIKAFPLELTGAGSWDEAVVTAGGVSVREIDPKTMESRKLPGLYLAGELLDVDAYTGGFNLQIAWATGFVAGSAAAQEGEAS